MAIDELAAQLGRDPIDFRLQNVLNKNDRAFTGNTIEHDVYLTRSLEWVRERSDWDKKRAQFAAQSTDQEIRRGLGVPATFMAADSAARASTTPTPACASKPTTP
jgi:CO/xanthine dehydrogenase Mo-binding subunit